VAPAGPQAKTKKEEFGKGATGHCRWSREEGGEGRTSIGKAAKGNTRDRIIEDGAKGNLVKKRRKLDLEKKRKAQRNENKDWKEQKTSPLGGKGASAGSGAIRLGKLLY